MNQHTKSAINRKLIQQILDNDPSLEIVVSLYHGVVDSVFLHQKGSEEGCELAFVVDEYPDGHE